MEFLKQIRWNMGVNALLTIFIGILFIVNPGGTTALIATVAGIVILVMGIADVIRYFTSGGYGFLYGSLSAGIIKGVLGLFILTHTAMVITLLSYLISIFIIISGVNSLEGAMQLRRGGVRGWGVNLALALAFIVIGILILIFPIDAASSMMVLVGVILVADGLSGLFTARRMRKIAKGYEDQLKNIRDAINGNIIDM